MRSLLSFLLGLSAFCAGAPTIRIAGVPNCEYHEQEIESCVESNPAAHATYCEQYGKGLADAGSKYCEHVADCHQKHTVMVESCGSLNDAAVAVNETGEAADRARAVADHQDPTLNGPENYRAAIARHGAAIGLFNGAVDLFNKAHQDFRSASENAQNSFLETWPPDGTEGKLPASAPPPAPPQGANVTAAKAATEKAKQQTPDEINKAKAFGQAAQAAQAKHEQTAQAYRTMMAANTSDPKDLDAARKYLDSRLKDNPSDPSALRLRAMDAYSRGDCGSAAADAGAALKQNPADKKSLGIASLCGGEAPSASLAQGGGFSKGSTDELASGPQGPASKAAPPPGAPLSSQSAYFAAQAAQAVSGRDYEKALALAHRALELDASNASAWRTSAMANNKLKNYEQAIRDADAGLKLNPLDRGLLGAKAFAQNRVKDYKGALATADLALKADPKDASAWMNRAYSLAGLGDRPGMIEALRQAAAIDPRFQDRLQAALQLPSSEDPALLFLEDEKAGAAAGPGRLPSSGRSFGLVVLSAAAGGILLALGLWTFFRPERRRFAVLETPSTEGALVDGKYEILGRIGEDAAGALFEAVDRSLDRKVVVKQLASAAADGSFRRRLDAARAAAALHHPNIVDLYAAVEQAGDVYLIFEKVPGRTLAEAVAKDGRLPFSRAAGLARGLAAALDFAASQGIAHGALKPSSVWIDEEGRPRVADFEGGKPEEDIRALGACLRESISGFPSGAEDLLSRAASGGFSDAKSFLAAWDALPSPAERG